MIQKITNPEILKTWILSTGHLTKKDSELINNQNDLPYAEILSAGWRTYVVNFDKVFATELLKLGFSKHFINLIKIAKEIDCNWIEFDRDGRIYPELPEFEWEKEK